MKNIRPLVYQQLPPLVLIGHPLAPIGRGEDLRCAARAARTAGLPFYILDLDHPGRYLDPDLTAEFEPHLTDRLSEGLNLFFLNGDEIERVLDRRPELTVPRGTQVIVPQWELECYPREWAIQLERFDEVWAPSTFVYEAISKAAAIPVKHISLSVEIQLDSFLPRRYFSLPESSFLFLFFFDYSGYLERKNPSAVLEAFERLCRVRGLEDVGLVIKTNIPWPDPRFEEMRETLVSRIHSSPFQGRMILIQDTYTDVEIKNLLRCCDCFLSLHRSEGFGRGLAEAMYLEKPVIGTGYSGNLDFMRPENSYLVDYSLIPVQPGQYPHPEGQVWADPDIEQVVRIMGEVLDDREAARRLGVRGSLDIRTHFSYRAIGLQIADQLVEGLQHP